MALILCAPQRTPAVKHYRTVLVIPIYLSFGRLLDTRDSRSRLRHKLWTFPLTPRGVPNILPGRVDKASWKGGRVVEGA